VSHVGGSELTATLVDGNLGVPLAGDILASTTLTPPIGGATRLVVVGDPGSSTQPLEIVAVPGREFAEDPNLIDIQVFHASTNAPSPVEVYFSDVGDKDLSGPPDIATLEYSTISAILEKLPFDDYLVDLSTDGSTSAVEFNIDINGSFMPGDSLLISVVGDATPVTALSAVTVNPAGVVRAGPGS